MELAEDQTSTVRVDCRRKTHGPRRARCLENSPQCLRVLLKFLDSGGWLVRTRRLGEMKVPRRHLSHGVGILGASSRQPAADDRCMRKSIKNSEGGVNAPLAIAMKDSRYFPSRSKSPGAARSILSHASRDARRAFFHFKSELVCCDSHPCCSSGSTSAHDLSEYRARDSHPYW